MAWSSKCSSWAQGLSARRFCNLQTELNLMGGLTGTGKPGCMQRWMLWYCVTWWWALWFIYIKLITYCTHIMCTEEISVCKAIKIKFKYLALKVFLSKDCWLISETTIVYHNPQSTRACVNWQRPIPGFAWLLPQRSVAWQVPFDWSKKRKTEALKAFKIIRGPYNCLICMAVCQNLVPLVNIKIAGKWMFIPLKMYL